MSSAKNKSVPNLMSEEQKHTQAEVLDEDIKGALSDEVLNFISISFFLVPLRRLLVFILIPKLTLIWIQKIQMTKMS